MAYKAYEVPVSVKGIVIDGGKVWLRKNERDEWELPGGKIDEGEQPEETVAREMQEELGFEVKVEDVIDAHMYTIQGSIDESHGVLVLTYSCEKMSVVSNFELEGEAGPSRFETFEMNELNDLKMPEFYKIAIRKVA